MNNSNIASEIKSTQGNYKVYVGDSLFNEIFTLTKKEISNGRAFLVSDEKIFSNLTTKVIKNLEKNGIKAESLTLDIDESKKNLLTVNSVYKWLHKRGVERSDILISIGGGVVTDLVGYVAATWLRGIKIIHIPTTLAAMVDASIGGKTAVNLENGKNLIGAFHHPKLIIMDTTTLLSLPEREMNSGWAEAIKHAFLFDKDLLNKFNNFSKSILAKEESIFTEVIKRNVEIKASVVAKDEFETGQDRIRLNFGHTIGHALEAITNYNTLLHGEAVSIGMVVASVISSMLTISENNLTNEIKETLGKYNLPTKIPKNIDLNDLYDICKSDKKVKNGRINWVLLKSSEESIIYDDVSDKIVIQALKGCQ